MKAIILAAGRGSRMKGMTDDRPKCLVELRGKALLEWQLEALKKAGIHEIAIVTGYKRELLAGYGLVEFHNPRWAETNMVSSLGCAHEWLNAEPCIVSYSDIFYDVSAVTSLMDSAARLAVTFDPHWLELWEQRFENPLLDAETFRLNSDGTVAEIGNKPVSVEDVQGQYMGLLRFTPDGWHEVVRIWAGLTAAEGDKMHMTGTLQKVIEAGKIPVSAIPYEREWGEIDSADDIEVYESRGEPVLDFLFLIPRPEFADFVTPMLGLLEADGYRCLAARNDEIGIFVERLQAGLVSSPRVVVSTNEISYISRFQNSKKVLLGHSFFIRDTIPTPTEQGADYFFDFDFFFAPSIFYLEWTIRALFDANYFAPHKTLREASSQGLFKCVIPGGYAKKLPSIEDVAAAKEGIDHPLVLYAPSVFSPEHTGHRFHLDGREIVSALSTCLPNAIIICRPHPTDFHRETVRDAIVSFADAKNIHFSLENTPDPMLYAIPDVVITDMSGFAFVHEWLTKRRPIFMIQEEESRKHPRFISLARQFGHVVHDVDRLIAQVQAQLSGADMLSPDEVVRFNKLFGLPFNNPQALKSDLVLIHNGTSGPHWLRIPITY